ncbi:MAG: hypothetical protein ACREF8_07390, partial [Chthoniobacterales bacterium]
SRTGSARGVGENVLVSGRVGIEIVLCCADAPEMIDTVRAEQLLFAGLVRLAPFPIGMHGLQMLRARSYPRRTLGMTGSAIFCGARIVKDDHAFGRRRLAKFAQ